MDTKTSNFLHHTSCESCGSSDGNGVFDDGHTYCYVCSKVTSEGKMSEKVDKPRDLIDGEVQALNARKISEETCKKFGYKVGELKGKKVQIAPYYLNGELVKQKLRFADKTFSFIGNSKKFELFGQRLWSSGKMVVVTEGEIDAMSVSQAQGNKWPVVSVPNGAQGAKKSLVDNLDFLEGFERVILMFDMDEPGQLAAKECAEIFTPGKCSIASLTMKDANELLKCGREAEIISAIWNAKPYRPEGLLSGEELREKASNKPSWGLSYPWKALTDITYGIREREVITLLAGTGMGKTEVFKEIAYHLIRTHKVKVGILFLEETPGHTLNSLVSKELNKRVYLPDVEYTEEEYQSALDVVTNEDSLIIYNHQGTSDVEIVIAKVRQMVSAGCRYIFLDHITAMAEGKGDANVNGTIHEIMEALNKLVQNLPFGIFLISHLKKSGGTKSYEEGGHINLGDAYGSSAIAQRSNFILALEGNQQAQEGDEDSNQRVIRVLKDRLTGQSVGKRVHLSYDAQTGRLNQEEEEQHGF